MDLAKYVTNLGYKCLSAVTPFYYKFDFSEIKDYYETIVRETGNYMIIYSIPFLTGVNISLSQFAELFKNEKIIGVKFTAGDFYLLERVRKAFPDKLIFEMCIRDRYKACQLMVDMLYKEIGKSVKKIILEPQILLMENLK